MPTTTAASKASISRITITQIGCLRLPLMPAFVLASLHLHPWQRGRQLLHRTIAQVPRHRSCSRRSCFGRAPAMAARQPSVRCLASDSSNSASVRRHVACGKRVCHPNVLGPLQSESGRQNDSGRAAVSVEDSWVWWELVADTSQSR